MARKIKNIAGQRFGKLVVLEPTEKRSGSNIIWKYLCDCGQETFVNSNNVQSGSTKSCGCSQWHRNHVTINPPLHEFLEGNLLGDGCIYIQKNRINARYMHSSKYESLVDYYKNLFSKYGILCTEKIRRRLTKLGLSYNFQTRSYIEFTPYRYRWYPEGKKIVPSDLEITSEVLLWWYVGDGSCANQYSTSQITLYTNGFDEQYVDLLINKLKEKGIEATKNKKYQIGKKQYILHVKASSVQRFFDYMSPLPEELKPIYGYKWNYRVREVIK